ncbi:MAG TPA: DNA polymerase III subunit gamma/tau C-terminal domain-containing protein, partial [Verrucomicrobiae bacterium]|nr:DNA polymerase III subunit gamma/tau C-terminal domain-containing protein [Verrucomicrobiae bacterium]
LQFNLRRLPAATIRELLGQVLANEGLKADAGALSEIARAADGSMRDGLSLLDQAIAFCGGKDLGRAQVEDMLGTQGRQILFEVLRAVVAGQGDALLACVDKLDVQAPDYAALLNDLACILQRAGVLQVLPQAADEGDDPAIGELAKAAAPEDVQVWYQIVINGRRDLPWAPDPRLGFEMTLLRLLAFRPGEAGSTQPAGAGSTTAARPVAGGARAAPLAGDAGWPARVAALELEGFAKQLARHCGWSGREGNVVRLSLDDKMKHLLVEDRRMGLEQALSRQLGEPIELRIEPAANPGMTPAKADEQKEIDRQRAAESAIEADPMVQALKDKLGAKVRAGSVQPVDSNGAGK